MPPDAPALLSEPQCVWPAGATLGEGTCWSPREQSLYWVDILEHRLYRYTPASGERREWRFDAHWLRVRVDDRSHQLTLSSHGRTLVIGAFLNPEERLELAKALRAALAAHRQAPD